MPKHDFGHICNVVKTLFFHFLAIPTTIKVCTNDIMTTCRAKNKYCKLNIISDAYDENIRLNTEFCMSAILKSKMAAIFGDQKCLFQLKILYYVHGNNILKIYCSEILFTWCILEVLTK